MHFDHVINYYFAINFNNRLIYIIYCTLYIFLHAVRPHKGAAFNNNHGVFPTSFVIAPNAAIDAYAHHHSFLNSYMKLSVKVHI